MFLWNFLTHFKSVSKLNWQITCTVQYRAGAGKSSRKNYNFHYTDILTITDFQIGILLENKNKQKNSAEMNSRKITI